MLVLVAKRVAREGSRGSAFVALACVCVSSFHGSTWQRNDHQHLTKLQRGLFRCLDSWQQGSRATQRCCRCPPLRGFFFSSHKGSNRNSQAMRHSINDWGSVQHICATSVGPKGYETRSKHTATWSAAAKVEARGAGLGTHLIRSNTGTKRSKASIPFLYISIWPSAKVPSTSFISCSLASSKIVCSRITSLLNASEVSWAFVTASCNCPNASENDCQRISPVAWLESATWQERLAYLFDPTIQPLHAFHSRTLFIDTAQAIHSITQISTETGTPHSAMTMTIRRAQACKAVPLGHDVGEVVREFFEIELLLIPQLEHTLVCLSVCKHRMHVREHCIGRTRRLDGHR